MVPDFSRPRGDLPLKDDATSRFLPWLIALMVFLSSLACAGVLVVDDAIERWDNGISGTLTVQIPPVAAQIATSTPQELQASLETRIAQAMKIVTSSAGVVSARVLDKDETVKMLEPWLGEGALLRELPLPALIDVTIDRAQAIDPESLARKISMAVPGAQLDDHQVVMDRVIDLSRSFQVLALMVLVMVGLVTSLTIVYATRTGLAVHHMVIEILHLVGAKDEYIARQFSERALTLGLKGGVAGLLAALATILFVGWLAGRVESGLLPDLTLSAFGWVTICLIPLLAALLSMITARYVVLRSLARMP